MGFLQQNNSETRIMLLHRQSLPLQHQPENTVVKRPYMSDAMSGVQYHAVFRDSKSKFTCYIWIHNRPSYAIYIILRSRQNGNCWVDDFFNSISYMKIGVISLRFQLSISQYWFRSRIVIHWRRKCDKPLSESIEDYLNDASMSTSATVCYMSQSHVWQCLLLSVSMCVHKRDVVMSTMAPQITGVSAVYSIVSTGTDQRKHQSPMSVAFVRGIHRWPVNSPHQGV